MQRKRESRQIRYGKGPTGQGKRQHIASSKAGTSEKERRGGFRVDKSKEKEWLSYQKVRSNHVRVMGGGG